MVHRKKYYGKCQVCNTCRPGTWFRCNLCGVWMGMHCDPFKDRTAGTRTSIYDESRYEQLCLAWVFRLAEAAGCNFFRIFSGASGWMRCDEMHSFPHVDVSVARTMIPALAKTMISQQMWQESIASVIPTVKEQMAGEANYRFHAFPVTIHLYGGAKVFHEEAVAVILQYLALVDGCRDLGEYLCQFELSYPRVYVPDVSRDMLFNSLITLKEVNHLLILIK